MSSYNIQIIVIFCLEIFFSSFANSENPDEMQCIMLHLILVFTVCKRTHLEVSPFHLGDFTVCQSTLIRVSHVQRVNRLIHLRKKIQLKTNDSKFLCEVLDEL